MDLFISLSFYIFINFLLFLLFDLFFMSIYIIIKKNAILPLRQTNRNPNNNILVDPSILINIIPKLSKTTLKISPIINLINNQILKIITFL